MRLSSPRPSEEIWEYGREVRAQTLEYMAGLRADQLSNTSPWATPYQQGYTIGRMFGHILCELSQHLGHIRYLRGLQRGLDAIDRKPAVLESP